MTKVWVQAAGALVVCLLGGAVGCGDDDGASAASDGASDAVVAADGGTTEDTTAAGEPVDPTAACAEFADAVAGAATAVDPLREVAAALNDVADLAADDPTLAVFSIVADAVREAVVELNSGEPEPGTDVLAWGATAMLREEASDVGLADCAAAVDGLQELLVGVSEPITATDAASACTARLAQGDTVVPPDLFTAGTSGVIGMTYAGVALQQFLADLERLRFEGVTDPATEAVAPQLRRTTLSFIAWDVVAGGMVDGDADAAEAAAVAELLMLGEQLDAAGANCLPGA